MMSKFKVGNFIKTGADNEDTTAGHAYEVIELDEDGTAVYIDDVGDECWALDAEGWSIATPLAPNDTVRLKSSEPFTTGAYTATVDSVCGDKVILTHGSWLPGDAVELAPTPAWGHEDAAAAVLAEWRAAFDAWLGATRSIDENTTDDFVSAVSPDGLTISGSPASVATLLRELRAA